MSEIDSRIDTIRVNSVEIGKALDVLTSFGVKSYVIQLANYQSLDDQNITLDFIKGVNWAMSQLDGLSEAITEG